MSLGAVPSTSLRRFQRLTHDTTPTTLVRKHLRAIAQIARHAVSADGGGPEQPEIWILLERRPSSLEETGPGQQRVGVQLAQDPERELAERATIGPQQRR
jgi:hypothetical protein